MYDKSKYASLTNLTVAVFPKNDIEEWYPQATKYEIDFLYYEILISRTQYSK